MQKDYKILGTNNTWYDGSTLVNIGSVHYYTICKSKYDNVTIVLSF